MRYAPCNLMQCLLQLCTGDVLPQTHMLAETESRVPDGRVALALRVESIRIVES
jgi:hypothetical protein